jgi:hypothetical protein
MDGPINETNDMKKFINFSNSAVVVE